MVSFTQPNFWNSCFSHKLLFQNTKDDQVYKLHDSLGCYNYANQILCNIYKPMPIILGNSGKIVIYTYINVKNLQVWKMSAWIFKETASHSTLQSKNSMY